MGNNTNGMSTILHYNLDGTPYMGEESSQMSVAPTSTWGSSSSSSTGNINNGSSVSSAIIHYNPSGYVVDDSYNQMSVPVTTSSSNSQSGGMSSIIQQTSTGYIVDDSYNQMSVPVTTSSGNNTPLESGGMSTIVHYNNDGSYVVDDSYNQMSVLVHNPSSNSNNILGGGSGDESGGMCTIVHRDESGYVVDDSYNQMSVRVNTKKNIGEDEDKSSDKEASNEQKANMCECQCSFKKTASNAGKNNNIKSTTTSQVIQSIAAGNVDKRVSLTVSPKTYQRDETKFVDKVKHVLGEQKYRQSWIRSGSYFYGLLRNALGTSSGLIFPYTPNVSFSHQTNYSSVEIIHSNLTYNYYKNTPPPSIKIDAKFTADNRDNALHMLSAIWFLIACSKCEFGEKSAYAGLPPPVLYLNGYDHLMDNIPVVITSVGYSYPESKHYVNLVLDFSQEYNHRGSEWKGGDTSFDNDSFCKIYTSSTASVTEKQQKVKNNSWIESNDITSAISGFFKNKNSGETWQTVSGSATANYKNNGIVYSFWLPTDMQINIGLAVQPNLIKTRKQWTLEGYKSGILLANDGKNPPVQMPGQIGEESLNAINSFRLSDTTNPGNNIQSQLCSCQCPSDASEMLNFIPSGWTW